MNPLMENFITVRVFFKILNDPAYELTKKVFSIESEEKQA
jgi:hypothetical protein